VIRKPDKALAWQSKTILLLVVPWTAASVVLQAHWWGVQVPVVAWTTLGISGIFGLIVWWLRAGTPAAAATGAAITASLMFATTQPPYPTSWARGGLMPLLTLFLLTFIATKIGRSKKDRLGTGEDRRGRNAAQVAANLGVAALTATLSGILIHQQIVSELLALAALAEAAADTVSSEIGQVFGGTPRMLTTLQQVEPGTDGGMTLAGSCAGIVAALIVSAVGVFAAYGDFFFSFRCLLTGVLALAGTFGLLFDSLLGATLERAGRLNNDAVNFLSTLSAPTFAAVLLFFVFRGTQF
jgi:uncharacterized protein (TIGR00297 family)